MEYVWHFAAFSSGELAIISWEPAVQQHEMIWLNVDMTFQPEDRGYNPVLGVQWSYHIDFS